MIRFHKENAGAFLNFLLAKYEMYTGAIEVASRPYCIAIDPSSICQLRCPTCPTGLDNESARDHESSSRVAYRSDRRRLAPDAFDALLDELGEHLFQILFYNWGEPLLNPNLPAYIRRARAAGIRTDINSNLSLQLSDGFIEQLLTSGVDAISASVDGFSQATYRRYRVGGRLDLVKHNLERLARARDNLGLETDVEWNLLVFAFNEPEIPAAAAWCRERGIAFNVRDAFIDEPSWLPSHRKGELPMLKPPEWRRDRVWSPLGADRSARSPSRCGWHYGYSVINADGSVSPCCAAWHEKDDFGVTRAKAVRFADVWNNDLVRRSRAAFSERPQDGKLTEDLLCARCPYGEGVQHLYSVFDGHVALQFQRVIGHSEPALAKAFDLMMDLRFGSEWKAQVREHGAAAPIVMTHGNESDAQMKPWVELFERELLEGAQVRRQ